MITWGTNNAWESEHGDFVRLTDHERAIEGLLMVIRLIGVGILTERDEGNK